MSFKIKKWSSAFPVDVRDLVPGAGNMSNPDNGRALAFSWAGKILFLFHDSGAAYEACYAWYDPALSAWSDVYRSPGGITEWMKYSGFYGDSCQIYTFGSQYLYAMGLFQGDYYGTGLLYGWDAEMNFIRPGFPEPYPGEWNRSFYSGYSGLAPDRTPGQLWYCTDAHSGYGALDGATEQVLVQSLLGTTVLYSGAYDSVYRKTVGGLSWMYGQALGDYVAVRMAIDPQDWRVYGEYPLDGSEGSFLGNAMLMAVQSYGDGAWLSMIETVGNTEYVADPSAPLTPTALPFTTTWEWRRMRDGLGYALDGGDLDGIAHGEGLAMGEPSYNTGNGLYVSIPTGATISTSYNLLDPHQPIGRAVLPHQPGASAIGWLGDFAIRPNLKVESVLPFPDARAATLYTAPPQEQSGYVLGQKEVYKAAGGGLTFHKDLVVELDGYSTSDPNWWFPGDWIDPDHHHGFWQHFAGDADIVLGRMPDPDFGALDMMGNDTVAFGLGKPSMNLSDPAASAFVLRSSDAIAGTTFVGPVLGYSNQHSMLISAPDGPARLYYYEWAYSLLDPPVWNALAGNIVAGAFVPTFEPADAGFTIPALGQTPGQGGWTVWSVVPIKPCRALPKGGYLVGATLYFAPWEPGGWEYVVGARDLTFRDSGQGWIPAKPGADGPSSCLDYHQPIYKVVEDEWTANRSLYGPDALLVFDDTGAFVECLNSADLYPPNGREIMVTREPSPRVIFRIYRHGTYSDYAEAWGQYHALASDEEIQAPLYACYDLMDARGLIKPGAGAFRGFLDMHDVGRLGSSWRWDSCAPDLYNWEYPKSVWSPPGPVYVRAGKGGLSITPLAGGPASTRNGVRGVGSRA